jgi:hypothetical protein
VGGGRGCTPIRELVSFRPKKVFVTSRLLHGDLVSQVSSFSVCDDGITDGLMAGDCICQDLADSSGLPGRYFAWLSDSNDSPSTRFTQSFGPYELVDGTIVADDYVDLTDRTLDNPIIQDERGDPAPLGGIAWTGTFPDGTSVGDNCQNWEEQSGDHVGSFGQIGVTDDRWTYNPNSPQSCGTFLRLYCFQQ